jgi:hypothetical protein
LPSAPEVKAIEEVGGGELKNTDTLLKEKERNIIIV